MKFYVASGLENIGEARRLVALLRERGHEPTYEWMGHGPVWSQGAARVREVAVAELQGVRGADVVIVRLPGGRGTHVEMGAALVAGAPVIIYATPDKFEIGPNCCAFYHHPRVVARVTTDEELLAALLAAWNAQLPRIQIQLR